MAGKFEAPRGGGNPNPRRRRKRRRSPVLPLGVILAVIVLAIILWPRGSDEDAPDTAASTGTTEGSSFFDRLTTGSQPQEATVPPETEPPVQLVSTATISAQGDLLIHKGIINSCKKEDGSYDFSSVFQYLKSYTTAYDYAVANLETTFGGTNYPYQGNPSFNCPDSLRDAVVDAGFDMLLTANNHSSDTDTQGILRTAEQVRAAGLEALGTQLTNEEPKYSIVEINGIKIGMLCYTYATNEYVAGRPSLNYKNFVEQPGIVNYFLDTKLDRFYAEVQTHLVNMAADGAEATMLYIHWGEEYYTTENATQRAIAQKMCDLGIDVIVGGHPHMVQPVDLLESSVDPDHKTVCIYSVGNAVSNQMKDEDKAFTSGHTEDGALFGVTFEKYSDGSVYLADVDLLPTWVNRHTNNGTREYNIIPLDISRQAQWAQAFGLSADQLVFAQESYDRTMAIVGQGLTECRDYLEQAAAERNA